jgi:hypothetical protein
MNRILYIDLEEKQPDRNGPNKWIHKFAENKSFTLGIQNQVPITNLTLHTIPLFRGTIIESKEVLWERIEKKTDMIIIGDIGDDNSDASMKLLQKVFQTIKLCINKFKESDNPSLHKDSDIFQFQGDYGMLFQMIMYCVKEKPKIPVLGYGIGGVIVASALELDIERVDYEENQINQINLILDKRFKVFKGLQDANLNRLNNANLQLNMIHPTNAYLISVNFNTQTDNKEHYYIVKEDWDTNRYQAIVHSTQTFEPLGFKLNGKNKYAFLVQLDDHIGGVILYNFISINHI